MSRATCTIICIAPDRYAAYHFYLDYFMRFWSPLLITAALTAFPIAQAADSPTIEQIQAAVDAGVAKSPSPLPISLRITSLRGCRPSAEVKQETVCLVGMSSGMRDGYTVLPLRRDGDTWTGVQRKGAEFPGPTPDEAKAAMNAWAEHELATNPEAANDAQIKAAPTIGVTAVELCEAERKTGFLHCEATLTIPGQADVKTDFKFELDSTGWRFVPRR